MPSQSRPPSSPGLVPRNFLDPLERPSHQEAKPGPEKVSRQLADIPDNEWERRITLQGVPVISLPIPSNYNNLVTSGENGERQQKRKASAIQTLSQYWDNSAPLHQFGQESQWLFRRLSGSHHATRLILPVTIPTDDLPAALESTSVWEPIVQSWLDMDSSKRKAQLDSHFKHVVISNDDPRKGLRGQAGVVAHQNIQPFTVLGPYVGKYCHGKDLREEKALYGRNVGRYAVDCTMNAVRLDLCGYGYGNITVCINANTTYRPGDPARPANVFFALVIYRNWPYIFIVSQAHILKGEEILLDYGTVLLAGLLTTATPKIAQCSFKRASRCCGRTAHPPDFGRSTVMPGTNP